MERIAASIKRGLEQALAYVDGTGDPSDYRVHVPAEIDVRAIRDKLGMSQSQFSIEFGFSINTVRHWEQKNRQPEGPTRAYLTVIDRAPDEVMRALRG